MFSETIPIYNWSNPAVNTSANAITQPIYYMRAISQLRDFINEPENFNVTISGNIMRIQKKYDQELTYYGSINFIKFRFSNVHGEVAPLTQEEIEYIKLRHC